MKTSVLPLATTVALTETGGQPVCGSGLAQLLALKASVPQAQSAPCGLVAMAVPTLQSKAWTQDLSPFAQLPRR